MDRDHYKVKLLNSAVIIVAGTQEALPNANSLLEDQTVQGTAFISTVEMQ